MKIRYWLAPNLWLVSWPTWCVLLCPISHVHTANIALAVLCSNFLSVFSTRLSLLRTEMGVFTSVFSGSTEQRLSEWRMDCLPVPTGVNQPGSHFQLRPWRLLLPPPGWLYPDSMWLTLPFRSPLWSLLIPTSAVAPLATGFTLSYWIFFSSQCFWSFLMLIYSCVCCSFSTTIENSSDWLITIQQHLWIVPSTEEALNRFCRIDKPGTHSS